MELVPRARLRKALWPTYQDCALSFVCRRVSTQMVKKPAALTLFPPCECSAMLPFCHCHRVQSGGVSSRKQQHWKMENAGESAMINEWHAVEVQATGPVKIFSGFDSKSRRN